MAHEEEKDLVNVYLDISRISDLEKETKIGHELGVLLISEGLRNGDPLLIESGKSHIREAVDRKIDAAFRDSAES
jgi:hypothetical protein